MGSRERTWPPRPVPWPEILTETQAAQFLGLDDGRTVAAARTKMRRLRHVAGLPYSKSGRSIFYDRDRLREWVAGHNSTKRA